MEGRVNKLQHILVPDGDSGAGCGKGPVTFLRSSAKPGIDFRLSSVRLRDLTQDLSGAGAVVILRLQNKHRSLRVLDSMFQRLLECSIAPRLCRRGEGNERSRT